MATTTRQDQQFIADVISRTILEESIQWISENMEPDAVFSEQQLATWAEGAGYEMGGK